MKFNNETLKTAVKGWVRDSKKSEIKYGHISDWDVSNVTDMSEMFKDASKFNQDLSKWDVRNVTNMSYMFSCAKSFNQDIGNWDVSRVIDMTYMFVCAESFNQDIGNWDVSRVKDMTYMFSWAESFNQDIGNWDVNSLTCRSGMFYSCADFNQDVKSWKWFNDGLTKMVWQTGNGMFVSTDKFIDELKKHIDTHDETAEIEVLTSGVREEYFKSGTWKNKKFKMKGSIPLKNAIYQFDGTLSDFIEQIGTEKITELDGSILDLYHIGDDGGSYEVDETIWDPKLTKEEESEFNKYYLLNFLMDVDAEEIFEKGCIYEINVKLGIKTVSLT